jgi:glucosamine-6-phosphate deaminase
MTPIGSSAGEDRVLSSEPSAELPGELLGERTDGHLVTRIYASAAALGEAAAADFADAVSAELETQAELAIIFASANSQLPFLRALRARDDIEWARLHVLHMDEYLGMPGDHPASFRRFLDEHLVRHVHPAGFHRLAGDAADPQVEVERYSALLKQFQPEICVLGIGENGHLAFNDPPADFETDELVHSVELDAACRRQQWQEGHFPNLADVPSRALSLTVPALLRPRHIFGIVPETRKAAAVKAALEGPVSPNCPASILRTAFSARLYLDAGSASLLSRRSGGPA